MKNLKRIDEAVGSILERRAAADRLLKDVINGNTSEVEGIKLSKQMAQGFLDWLKYSVSRVNSREGTPPRIHPSSAIPSIIREGLLTCS